MIDVVVLRYTLLFRMKRNWLNFLSVILFCN